MSGLNETSTPWSRKQNLSEKAAIVRASRHQRLQDKLDLSPVI